MALLSFERSSRGTSRTSFLVSYHNVVSATIKHLLANRASYWNSSASEEMLDHNVTDLAWQFEWTWSSARFGS